MTGPRLQTVHPLARRPWRLLPFLASVTFFPLGCSDQPTEPITTTTPVAGVVSHPVPKPAGSRISGAVPRISIVLIPRRRTGGLAG